MYIYQDNQNMCEFFSMQYLFLLDTIWIVNFPSTFVRFGILELQNRVTKPSYPKLRQTLSYYLE